MASTHTSRTILASVSNAAAATVNGTEWNNSAAYGGVVMARITNGATGPTIGCDVVVYTGHATTVKREYSRQTAGVANNGVYDFPILIPAGAMFVNLTFTGNTAQAVTVEAYAQELTTI